MAKRSTTDEEKVQIIERHQNGESLRQIAEDLQLNTYTVRKWWRKYRNQGWLGLASKMGRKPRGHLSTFDSRIKYVALRLKVEHPGWGLDVLLLHLKRRASLQGKKLPKRTALYNYLKPYYARFAEQPRYPTGRPDQSADRPKAVHQRWQMDFKGYVKVKGVGNVTPFNICDAFLTAPLQGKLYTHAMANPLTGVSWRDIQANLRQAFTQWGKPLELKMDRDPIFIGSSRFEWPSALLLWIVGLGIRPIVNPRASPTKNAQIERTNLTWLNHVGKTSLTYTKASLQQATNQAWNDRRLFLPTRNPRCNNQPPMVAFPELKHSKRSYDPKTEKQTFNMDKVHQYLSQWSWKRQVDTHGRISLGGNQRAISKDRVGQIVKVLFISDAQLFQVSDMDNKVLRNFAIPNISLEFLTQGV